MHIMFLLVCLVVQIKGKLLGLLFVHEVSRLSDPVFVRLFEPLDKADRTLALLLRRRLLEHVQSLL